MNGWVHVPSIRSPRHTGFMTDDLGWVGPACNVCGQELDAQTLVTNEGLNLVYMCREHGLVTITDPFDSDG